jgi:hypothetical protein
LTIIAASSSTLNDVEPGVLGFLVVAGIGVALVFLLRSMNKQFRKLTPPEEDDTQADTTGTGGADVGAGGMGGAVTGPDTGTRHGLSGNSQVSSSS